MDGLLNGSGERFQNNRVSVTRFTGFVLAEAANSCKKVCGLENIRIRVDVALKTSLYHLLCARLLQAREEFDFCAVNWRDLLNILRGKI